MSSRAVVQAPPSTAHLLLPRPHHGHDSSPLVPSHLMPSRTMLVTSLSAYRTCQIMSSDANESENESRLTVRVQRTHRASFHVALAKLCCPLSRMLAYDTSVLGTR